MSETQHADGAMAAIGILTALLMLAIVMGINHGETKYGIGFCKAHDAIVANQYMCIRGDSVVARVRR